VQDPWNELDRHSMDTMQLRFLDYHLCSAFVICIANIDHLFVFEGFTFRNVRNAHLHKTVAGPGMVLIFSSCHCASSPELSLSLAVQLYSESHTSCAFNTPIRQLQSHDLKPPVLICMRCADDKKMRIQYGVSWSWTVAISVLKDFFIEFWLR